MPYQTPAIIGVAEVGYFRIGVSYCKFDDVLEVLQKATPLSFAEAVSQLEKGLR